MLTKPAFIGHRSVSTSASDVASSRHKRHVDVVYTRRSPSDVSGSNTSPYPYYTPHSSFGSCMPHMYAFDILIVLHDVRSSISYFIGLRLSFGWDILLFVHFYPNPRICVGSFRPYVLFKTLCTPTSWKWLGLVSTRS